MSERNDRTNGFKVRALTDADRVAVQSTVQDTYFLTGRKFAGLLHRWHEVGLTRDEIVVLRPYGAAPEIEVEGLGGPHGVLIVNATQHGTRTLRNGQRWRIPLNKDESVVIKTEDQMPPGSERHVARV